MPITPSATNGFARWSASSITSGHPHGYTRAEATRVGRFAEGKVQLVRGQAPGPGPDAGRPVPGQPAPPGNHQGLEPGMDLLLDDGKLRLRVITRHTVPSTLPYSMAANCLTAKA